MWLSNVENSIKSHSSVEFLWRMWIIEKQRCINWVRNSRPREGVPAFLTCRQSKNNLFSLVTAASWKDCLLPRVWRVMSLVRISNTIHRNGFSRWQWELVSHVIRHISESLVLLFFHVTLFYRLGYHFRITKTILFLIGTMSQIIVFKKEDDQSAF